MKLSRRELVTVPLGLLAITAGLVALRRDWAARSRSLAACAALYRRIAEAYLDVNPEELDEKLLFDALFGHLEEPTMSSMTEELRRASRLDFEQGSTFLAEGWILSRTEGRLTALALLQSGVDLPARAARN